MTPSSSPPEASAPGISPAESSTSSTPSIPSTVPRYSRPCPALAMRMPRAANQAMVSSCSRPFDGTPSLSMPRPRSAPAAPRAAACRRPPGCRGRGRGRGSARRSARRWRSAAGRAGRAAARRRRSRRSIRAWCGRNSPRSAASPARSPRAASASSRRSSRSTAAPSGARPRARPRSSAERVGGGAGDAEHRLDPRHRAGVERRRARLDRQRGDPGGDVLGRAQADGGAGGRDELGHPPLGFGGGERCATGGGGGVAFAVAVEQRPEARRTPDVAAQRHPPGGAGVERVDDREGEAEVAGDEIDRRVGERLDDQAEHLGVGRRRIAGLEDLEAGLKVLARPVGAELLPPPDRAAVDVARRRPLPPPCAAARSAG